MSLTGQIVGRAAELAALELMLDGAVGGAAQVVLLLGEPGIGKTRLLDEFAARARARRQLVLVGRASEFEGELPLGVFVDALNDYLAMLEPRALRALGNDRLGELATVFPALGDGRSAALPADRFRIIYAIRALLERLAVHQPVVLALDDVHWADPSSLEAIMHMAHRRLGARVVLMLAMRPAQAQAKVARGLSTLADVLLELKPLTRTEATSLLTDVDTRQQDVVYTESGGNPFYLSELARLAALGNPVRGADLPERVAFAIADEVESLSPTGQTAAKAAAAVAERFDPDVLAAAGGLSEQDALRGIDELAARDLIRSTDIPSQFRFRHPLVRSAVYQATEPSWRLAAHQRIAAWLTARSAPANMIAPHVERSARPGDEQAIALLRAAGAETHVRAPAIAAHWYQATLRLLPDEDNAELLMALTTALGAAGQFTESLRRGEQALRLLPAEPGTGWIELTAFCASIEHQTGQHKQANKRLYRAAQEISDEDPAHAAELRLALSVDAMYAARWEEIVELGHAALRTARATGDPALIAAAAGAAGFGHQSSGDPQASRPLLEEAAALVDALSDHQIARRPDAPLYLGFAEMMGEQFPAAIRHLRRCAEVSLRIGAGYLYVPTAACLSWALADAGRLTEAVEQAQRAADSARSAGVPQALASALGPLAWWTAQTGDMQAALAISAEALASARRTEPNALSNISTWMVGFTYLEAGDPQQCVELISGPCDGFGHQMGAGCQEALTRAHLALGDVTAAEQAADNAAALASKTESHLVNAYALRARAAIRLTAGDPAAAEPALRAAELADAIGAPIHAARARLLAGRALAERDPNRAIAELSAAEDAFAEHGAQRWRDEAALALRALGHRAPARHVVIGGRPYGLSHREHEVATLLVEGKTNRQIGEQLFIGVRTVESHVARILAKIGVESRAAAAAELTRAGC